MVTLVTTLGTGSMDLYARKLAEHLDVPKLYSDIYQRNAELFNIPLLCRTAMKTAWKDWHFIRMLKQENSIVHLPNHHLGRYGVFLKVPYISTVHDLLRYFDLNGYNIFIHRPNLRDKLYLSLDYRGVEKATRVIAVSHTTKLDLVQHLGIPEEHISVVYEGIDHRVFKPVAHRLVDYLYLLFVGSEHPRKNFVGLLKAFSKLKSESEFKDLELVKVGNAGGPEAEFRKETLQAISQLGLSNDVVFTDYISEEDLTAYYSGAECFILPSFYEGFGFPPLEAMACGCPVIASNVSSLPEVVGKAAIQISPHDVDGLAKGIQEVLTNRNLRQKMIQEGFKQAHKFAWECAAQETLQVYQEVEEELRNYEVRKHFAYFAASFLEQGRAGNPKEGSERNTRSR